MYACVCTCVWGGMHVCVRAKGYVYMNSDAHGGQKNTPKSWSYSGVSYVLAKADVLDLTRGPF